MLFRSHGVEITDPAIVAAATLSHRYISGRQLPDKAIDLIDEAASRIRMELDSKPEVMDRLDRRIVQLKIEREALKKDKDKATKQRLENLEQELESLEKEYSDYEEQWTAEKLLVQGSSNLKEELETARLDLEAAHRAGDLARMSELQYGLIPELELQISQVAEAEQSRDHKSQLLRNKVDSDEVAEIVARWTGIPVSKMLEGEQDKLLRMEQVIGAQVIGQQEAVTAVSNAIRRSRAGLSDPGKPHGSFMFFGPTGVGKNERTNALAKFMFDTEDAMISLEMSEYMDKH